MNLLAAFYFYIIGSISLNDFQIYWLYVERTYAGIHESLSSIKLNIVYIKKKLPLKNDITKSCFMKLVILPKGKRKTKITDTLL